MMPAAAFTSESSVSGTCGTVTNCVTAAAVPSIYSSVIRRVNRSSSDAPMASRFAAGMPHS